MNRPVAFTARIKCHIKRPLHPCEIRKPSKPTGAGLREISLIAAMLAAGSGR